MKTNTDDVSTDGYNLEEHLGWMGEGAALKDDDGLPMVLHHFTYNDFEKFDRMYGHTNWKRDAEGVDTLGIWFTLTSYPIYVSPKFGGKRKDAIARCQKPLYYDDEQGDSVSFVYLQKDIERAGGVTAFRNQIMASGYDCVVLAGTKLDGYVQTVIVVLDEDDIHVLGTHDLTENAYTAMEPIRVNTLEEFKAQYLGNFA